LRVHHPETACFCVSIPGEKTVWFLSMKKVLVICMGLFMMSAAYQQKEDIVMINAKCKAIYLYNFTKYIEWPEDYKTGNFVIGVYGNYPMLLTELNRMASTKTAGSQKFEIKSVNTVEAASKYHI
jgi:hypothetical protein